jgi:hypothetical protein
LRELLALLLREHRQLELLDLQLLRPEFLRAAAVSRAPRFGAERRAGVMGNPGKVA